MSLSTTEAEHTAIADTTLEVIWARAFLKELGEEQTEPTSLHNDNQSAIKLVKSGEFHKRTKHIATKISFVKDEAVSGTVTVHYMPTTDMPADMLTKAVPAAAHERCREIVNMKKKSERGLKLKAFLTCLLVLSDATMTQAMFDSHPPIVWRRSKLDLVNGAEVIRINANLISPCRLYSELKNTPQRQVDELQDWCTRAFHENVMDRIMKMDTAPRHSKESPAWISWIGSWTDGRTRHSTWGGMGGSRRCGCRCRGCSGIHQPQQ